LILQNELSIAGQQMNERSVIFGDVSHTNYIFFDDPLPLIIFKTVLVINKSNLGLVPSGVATFVLVSYVPVLNDYFAFSALLKNIGDKAAISLSSGNFNLNYIEHKSAIRFIKAPTAGAENHMIEEAHLHS
jgi:hypothetical protein